nr:ATP-binding protein [uncultured Holophaga sp.]
MSLRPARHTRSLILLVLALALVGYCTFLLRDIYRAHSRLLKLNREHTLGDVEKEASALGYFLADRREDLTSLANNRDLLAYFENEALGMSMEYGLGASLVEASSSFRQFMGRKRLTNEEIYSRVGFLAPRGQWLIDTGEGEPWELPPSASTWQATDGEEPAYTYLPGPSPSLLLHRIYLFKGQRKGVLVTRFPLGPAYRWFTGSASLVDIPMGLAYQGQWAILAPETRRLLPGEKLPPPEAIPSKGSLKLSPGGRHEKIQHLDAYRIPVPDSALSLVAFLPTRQGQGQEPMTMILVAGAIGALILLGAFTLFRGESRNRQLNARFRAVFDNAGLSIGLMDPGGRFQEVNSRFAALLGFAQDEGGRFRIQDFLPRAEGPGALAFGLPAGPTGGGRLEQDLLTHDGHRIPCEVFTSPIIARSGQIQAVVVILIDMTEAHRAEQERQGLEAQLRQAQKMEAVGQLAAGIAHEINTPIQYIGDNAIFLSESLDTLLRVLERQAQALTEGAPSEVREELARAQQEADLDFLAVEIPRAAAQIREGARRVGQIVQAMKEFSQRGEGRSQVVDLNRTIESTIIISRNSWEQSADMLSDLDPELPPVECLEDDIKQVILALIMNAAEALGEQLEKGGRRGSITISTRRFQKQVEVRVQDTGPGIPEMIQGRIFEPFFTTKEVGKGMGQGLAVAYQVVVERHQGSLHFETAQGVGTAFIIRLPIRTQG